MSISEQTLHHPTLQRQITAFDVLLEKSSGKSKFKSYKFVLIITVGTLFVLGITGMLVKFLVFDKFQLAPFVNESYFEEISGESESILLIGGNILQTGEVSNSLEVLSSKGCKELPR